MRKQPLRFFCSLIFLFLSCSLQAQTTSSCFRVQAIQADACGPSGTEGQNEIVRFLVGPSPLTTASLSVSWATTSNSWDGICQNASTANKVAQMNATIQNCGLLKEPSGGVLPANSKVLLISGINFDPTTTTFAGLSDTLYVIFHCSAYTGGNFSNTASTIRYFTMTFSSPAGCTQTVSYFGSQLVGGDGALANFDENGITSYSNNGCNAPFVVYDPSWTPPAPMCSGAASVDLNTLVTGDLGGTWSGPGVTGNTFSPSGLSGDLDITYSFSPNCANAVSQTETITITSGGSATWTPQSVCSGGGTINLNTLITGTTGGTWTGTGVAGNTFDPSGLNGSISITYSIGSGACLATSTQNMTIVASANAAWAFNQTSLCASDPSINLNNLITGTSGGTWTGNGVTGNTFSPSGLSGNQTITYTVGTGNCVVSQSQSINVIITADASWTATSLCSSSQNLNLYTLVTGTTGGTWAGAGVSGNTFNPSGLTGAQSITYTVGSTGCLATAIHDITVVAQPIALILNGTHTFCSGTAITPITTTSSAGNTVTWFSDAALSVQVATGNSFTPPSGSATYYATQGVNGCQSTSSSFVITQSQTPLPPTLPTQVRWCAGTPLPEITAISDASIITWYSDVTLSNVIGTGLTYQVISSANSSYYIIAENNGCISSPSSTNFIAEGLVSAQILGNPIIKACLPKVVQLQSASALGNQWSTGSTQQSINITQAGVYILTQIGFCNTDSDTVTVEDVSVDASFNMEIPETGLLPLDVTLVPLGNESDECTWYLNGTEINLPNNSTLTFNQESEQVIHHVCSNQAGCIDTVTHTILVELKPQLFVPNSFTPNGDHVNDVFQIVGYHITQLNIRIFDRWGEEIYVITSPDGSWNGTMSSGKMVPDGVYLYNLNARDKQSKPYHLYGSILLMR